MAGKRSWVEMHVDQSRVSQTPSANFSYREAKEYRTRRDIGFEKMSAENASKNDGNN